jgi:hypothetical protein
VALYKRATDSHSYFKKFDLITLTIKNIIIQIIN